MRQLADPPRAARGCPVCAATDTIARANAHLLCRRCGLRFLPEVDQAALARVYADLVRSGRAGRIEAHRRPVYEAALAAAGAPPGARCLDVGCGAGAFVAFAAGRGFDVVGVDPAARAVTRVDGARIVAAAFPCPDVLGDERFDLVTFFNSLNYLDDPVAALVEARRVLRPGGHVLVRVPNASLHAAVSIASFAVGAGVPKRWLDRVIVFHPRSFTARALAVALDRAGFEAVRIAASTVTEGDPYRTGFSLLGVMKRVVRASAIAIAWASRNRLLWSPSLVAIGWRDARETHGGR